MSTIEGILEGKTANYFKLDDMEDNPFLVVESIDPKKTDIRSEKVPNKNKKEGEKDETEYFHILGRIGDVEKDLSLTYTAIKQLAAVMPGNDNWRGLSFKFNGKKGSGKNIKYNFQLIPGKTEVQSQTRITDQGNPQNDETVIKAVMDELKQSISFFKDGIFPESSIVSCAAKHLGAAHKAGTGGDVLNYLKSKGMIVAAADGYKVVV